VTFIFNIIIDLISLDWLDGCLFIAVWLRVIFYQSETIVI